MRKALLLFVVLLIGTLSATPYSGGDGSSDTPYRISSVEDWLDLMDPANSGDWDKQFILMEDIDFEDAELTPVAPDTQSNYGFQGVQFTGVFDGNFKVLSNAAIDMAGGVGQDYVGLFGYIGNGAEVKDLRLDNITVTGRDYVGLLAGQIGGGWPPDAVSVTNCYVTGTVSGQSVVGGLCGSNEWTSTIDACYAEVTVSGQYVVGGLCGENDGGIIASFATGSVSADEYTVGGFCGINWGSWLLYKP